MNFYGYKNHIKVDRGTKFVRAYAVSSAATHDSQELETLIDKDEAGQKLYSDSTYIGQDDSLAWCGMGRHGSGKSNSKKAIDKAPENKQSKEVTGSYQGKTRIWFPDQYHASDVYTYNRYCQSGSKNWFVKPDLQSDALCPAEKACAQCLADRISAPSPQNSGTFHTHKFVKEHVF